MGIKGLMKLLSDHAPGCIKERDISYYSGLKVAVDASMSLYQFLIAVRHGPDAEVLTNEAGEVTSHLQGLFYRTIRMLDNGIKPAFCFDGKPPQLKSAELDKRKEKRETAEADLKEAKDEEKQEDIEKYTKRLVKVTKEHNEEARHLLRLMGVPVVEAPGEAEAMCAALVQAEKVYATATEDMDALTFGSTRLLRHLTMSAQKGAPIVEVELAAALRGLGMTQREFIDLCILLGCDYTPNIRNVGPVKALKMIQEHRSIAAALPHLDKEKYKVPTDFMYEEAAALFLKPDVGDPAAVELKWTPPDEEGLIDFLVTKKGFALERVQGALKRLKAAQTKGTQKRMEGFFKVAEKPQSQTEAHEAAQKRKAEEAAKAKSKAAAGKRAGGKFAPKEAKKAKTK